MTSEAWHVPSCPHTYPQLKIRRPRWTSVDVKKPLYFSGLRTPVAFSGAHWKVAGGADGTRTRDPRKEINKLLFPKRRRSPHCPPRSPDLPVATFDTMPDLSSLKLPPDLAPLDLLCIKTVLQLRPELPNLQNPSC
jgi:hypothetical protein